jgi:SpoVK/Ycf46/Vps4 family AAA+-type ATPase
MSEAAVKIEYKCICCGEVKETDKQCGCPTCGYKMYPTPYDRKEILTGEIKGFIKKLELSEIKNGDLVFVGKAKDDKRFPDFTKIQSYACSSEKTEMFFQRIDQSLEQISEYIHAPFHRQYKVDFMPLKIKVDRYETVLIDALADLGIETEFDEIVVAKTINKKKKEDEKQPLWTESLVDYKENPNEELMSSVEELIALLEKLSEKIKKFIKLNNIYGSSHKKKPKDIFKSKPGAEINYEQEIDKSIGYVSKILDKKYEVDIFSDGTEELEEMLTGLWSAIAMIMRSPMLVSAQNYEMGGNEFDKEGFETQILNILHGRYTAIDNQIFIDSFLSDKDEEALFEIYNKMIDHDSFGFMGINASALTQIGESEKQLNTLIGLSSIKESILKIKAFALANKGNDSLNLHMCFYGNPGTGKTEVARSIAGILYENKILPSKKVVEVDRSGLVGEYLGETPQKTMGKIMQAMGGVLFIDEAYAIVPADDRGFDYGHEAIATLIKAMEDYRGKFCVILAGYKSPMEHMIAANPGFKSRIMFELDFPNYSRDELNQITDLMLAKKKYTLSDQAREKLLDITDVKRKDPNFANAREIRNILDQVIMCQNVRCMGSDDKEIAIVDVNKYIQDARINLPVAGSGASSKIMTGDDELEALIGLESVKRMVKKVKAYAKRNSGDANFNMHMVFYGNPGTGKTEVARIISRILYDAGVLDEAKLVETDARGILGKFVGETGSKTQQKVQDALGGVLFIDEAYALTEGDGKTTNYGDEAIAVLLKEMEDKRGQFCVILAGYKDEMQRMLSSNPGFESRLQFTLDFPDYSKEELGDIAKVFLEKKKYTISDDAFERILDIAEWFRKKPNFANARTIRNILDQVIMNQNLRVDDSGAEDDYLIIKDDVEDYILDEGLIKEDKPKIGFEI